MRDTELDDLIEQAADALAETVGNTPCRVAQLPESLGNDEIAILSWADWKAIGEAWERYTELRESKG